MELTKEVVIDQITVLEDGQMQIREVTRIMEDGKLLSKSYHRHVVTPLDDMSKQDKRVQDVARAVHTPAVKAAFETKRAAQLAELETASQDT